MKAICARNFIQRIYAKKHYHSFLNRGLYSLLLVSGILWAGTVGIHYFEKNSYRDFFYFTSMIATGQGTAPNLVPVTAAGKIFTCFLAFISVGLMVAVFGFLFGFSDRKVRSGHRFCRRGGGGWQPLQFLPKAIPECVDKKPLRLSLRKPARL